ncbi:MAG: hypothetical protein ACTSXJ_01240 [Candidatus Baldrarchaeia archaeon]
MEVQEEVLKVLRAERASGRVSFTIKIDKSVIEIVREGDLVEALYVVRAILHTSREQFRVWSYIYISQLVFGSIELEEA